MRIVSEGFNRDRRERFNVWTRAGRGWHDDGAMLVGVRMRLRGFYRCYGLMCGTKSGREVSLVNQRGLRNSAGRVATERDSRDGGREALM